jgi:hypothetical protein
MEFAMPIIAALRALEIEQFAGDIGHIYLAVILVFGFQQTAFAATIAQGFPLAPIQRFKRLFPERLVGA